MSGRTQKGGGQRIVRWFFFGAFLLLLHQSVRMMAAFYVPLLAAGLLAMALLPLHRRLLARLPRHPYVAAAATAVGAMLLVVLPLFGLGWVFFRDAIALEPVARAWLSGAVREPGRGWSALFPEGGALAGLFAAWHVDPQEILLRNLSALGADATGWAATLVRHVATLSLDTAAMLCLLFVLLRDGPTLLARLIELIPLPAEHKETLRARIADTIRAVINGALYLALIQGALAALGLMLLRLPFPVLLGALTTLASPIPIIGTNLILVPVIFCLYVSGHAAQAWKLAAWSFLVVSGADHVLRPILISSAAKLPVWLLFFGILGGLKLYGVAGLLVGPVLVTLALAFASIYRRDYAEVLTD
ncbi:MAG: AI-2E family transporter [Elusimicrobia bacterium]|nr:AI-2E family transporter [Elusimicrobiota bacterium]